MIRGTPDGTLRIRTVIFEARINKKQIENSDGGDSDQNETKAASDGELIKATIFLRQTRDERLLDT